MISLPSHVYILYECPLRKFDLFMNPTSSTQAPLWIRLRGYGGVRDELEGLGLVARVARGQAAEGEVRAHEGRRPRRGTAAPTQGEHLHFRIQS